MPSPKAGAQPRHQYDMRGDIVLSHYPTQAEIDHANAQRYGHFPELAIEQNRVIWEAREKGWDTFYPKWDAFVPSHEYTLNGAVEFLKGAK